MISGYESFNCCEKKKLYWLHECYWLNVIAMASLPSCDLAELPDCLSPSAPDVGSDAVLLFADRDRIQRGEMWLVSWCISDAELYENDLKNACHIEKSSGSMRTHREIWNLIMDSCMEEDEEECGKPRGRETGACTVCTVCFQVQLQGGGEAVCVHWLMSKRESWISSDRCIIHHESLLLRLTIRISLLYHSLSSERGGNWRKRLMMGVGWRHRRNTNSFCFWTFALD